MAKQTMNCRSHRWTWNAIFPLASWQLWVAFIAALSLVWSTRAELKSEMLHTNETFHSEMEESWMSSITKEASQLLEFMNNIVP
jgi:hypothetical protein